jgi:hypothetical protein
MSNLIIDLLLPSGAFVSGAVKSHWLCTHLPSRENDLQVSTVLCPSLRKFAHAMYVAIAQCPCNSV